MERKYCFTCGAKLAKREERGNYDIYTGKKLRRFALVCEQRERLKTQNFVLALRHRTVPY